MYTKVSISEAKAQLSHLIAKVEQGEEIIIARSGHPVARLAPLERPPGLRKPGELAGKVWIADDFDETQKEIIDSFET
ncbi:MAG: type II toxin-antitoxin system Phd/YefM family antitoxin [Acidimicrobiales bacterium]|nr:type II toxin-antitoxin system Phd/YefM family antitoxin [Acidimicrobiales bacterium]